MTTSERQRQIVRLAQCEGWVDYICGGWFVVRSSKDGWRCATYRGFKGAYDGFELIHPLEAERLGRFVDSDPRNAPVNVTRGVAT